MTIESIAATDSETPALPAATFSPAQFAQLLEALTQKAGGGFDKADLAEILQATAATSAQAMQKAIKPENETHPGKSCFSYPEGDVARPRPQIGHPLFWNGYPQHLFQEELHWSEAELMVQLQPGEYTCTQKDGRTTHPVTIKATKDGNGGIEKMDVTFAVSRERKDQIAPLFVMLYQLTHPEMAPRKSFMKGMQQHLLNQFGDDDVELAG